MVRKRVYGIAFGIAVCLLPLPAAGPSFIPDMVFKGASLAGWHVLGQADWRAENGEIAGVARPGSEGGWLVLDRSYQDIGLHLSLRCTGGCRTGVLFRAQKTAEGIKGIYVSLTQGDLASYRVVLGPDGRERRREPLRRAGGTVRTAPPPDSTTAPVRSGATPPHPAANMPIKPIPPGLHPGEWDEVEVFLDANIVRAFINRDREAAGGAADEEYGAYGPVALFAGGSGEVRFRNIAYKDLSLRVLPKEQVSSRFRMQRINDFYYAWSAAAADFNRDGILDIVAGPYIYFGPDYTKSREIFMAQASSPSREYASECMLQYAADMTGDGWPDVICSNLGTPVYLYVNPKGESRRWDKYQVIPRIQTEIMDLKDIDGDGKPELIYGADDCLHYAKPDPSNPTGPWVVHTISEPGTLSWHSIGVGDINGDGYPDILNVYGWWENPGPGSKQKLWTYHPQAFGRWTRLSPGGALMGVYDVNGDGLNDVVTSLEAHGFGLAWYEQKRDAAGKISFVEHLIMDNYWTKNAGNVAFSQAHSAFFADIDGDGIPDFIVGKRYWSHHDAYFDPDPYSPPVLYWYRTVRNPKALGGAEFVPELIHNRSGVGSEVLAVDLNKDGAMDIITATDRGTFIFWGRPQSGAGKKIPVSDSK